MLPCLPCPPSAQAHLQACPPPTCSHEAQNARCYLLLSARRPIMNLALTYDHRLIDGREAVTFLKRIKVGRCRPGAL